jgi:iron complex transport system ATP-binding protein
MLQVRDIRFSYVEPVLKGLSFEVGSGKTLAVLGPNGSGKTTLLKTIVGILSPSTGSVLIDGRNLTGASRREAARLIGYVAQESAVRFPLTAMEFVLQGRFAQGRLVGFESEEDVREAERAMDLTETTSFSSRILSELSGGERQRVMLARALASRPKLLVLDEPVANLDISHQVKMFDLVSRLVAEEGMSAVVVTHELNLAAEFATAVLLLKSGEVVAFGEPADALREERLRSVFETDLIVDVNPRSRAPRITLVRPGL